jgi:carbonic anhydrase
VHTHSEETQVTMTPEKALRFLQDGHLRFLANLRANRNLRQQVVDTREGQWPFAAVLGCIDSRVPAEIVFDQGIGDIFSARIAGNCVTDEMVGSLEFSCKIAGAKLIVVMGHTSCGAIKGACDDVKLGKLTNLLAHIKPAVDAVTEPEDRATRNSKNGEFVQNVAKTNVRLMAQKLLDESPVLQELLADRAIDIVTAMYDVSNGTVDFARLNGERVDSSATIVGQES